MTFDECVFFFFLPFSPRKKTNKQTRKTTVENLCASRLAAVELVTATRFYPHSLTREREFRLGLWQTGQEGGVKRIGGGTQPPTRGRSTHTHTHKNRLPFQLLLQEKIVFCRSNPCRVYVCVHELTEIEKNRYNSAMEATLSYFCPLENNIETKKI